MRFLHWWHSFAFQLLHISQGRLFVSMEGWLWLWMWMDYAQLEIRQILFVLAGISSQLRFLFLFFSFFFQCQKLYWNLSCIIKLCLLIMIVLIMKPMQRTISSSKNPISQVTKEILFRIKWLFKVWKG